MVPRMVQEALMCRDEDKAEAFDSGVSTSRWRRHESTRYRGDTVDYGRVVLHKVEPPSYLIVTLNGDVFGE